MSPKLPVVTGRQIAAIAVRLKFRLDRQRGSHAVYYRETDRRRIVIPMHAGQDISPKTLLGIVNDMGITIDQLRSML